MVYNITVLSTIQRFLPLMPGGSFVPLKPQTCWVSEKGSFFSGGLCLGVYVRWAYVLLLQHPLHQRLCNRRISHTKDGRPTAIWPDPIWSSNSSLGSGRVICLRSDAAAGHDCGLWQQIWLTTSSVSVVHCSVNYRPLFHGESTEVIFQTSLC